MSKLRLPNFVEDGLIKFLGLSLEERDLLTHLIENAPFSPDPSDLDTFLKEKTELDSSKVSEVFRALFSLATINEKPEVNVSTEEFANHIWDHLVEKGVEAGDDTIANFKKNLQTLFSSSSSLTLFKKGFLLTHDRQNLVNSSKILVDTRPVFGGVESDGIKAEVTMYTLRFTYQESSGSDSSKRIYFALDEKDLEELKGQIIRAEMKAKKVKATPRQT